MTELEQALLELANHGDFSLMFMKDNPKYKTGWVCQRGYFVIDNSMIHPTLEDAIKDALEQLK